MLLFTLIFFLVAFSAALSPKVFLALWYFHRSSYVCWLNTLKLTVVNEQVKIHWPIKSNFMLYTFSTVTPCYILYKRSTCEKRKYMVLPVTYICTICSSLLQLERTSAAYSWIGRPKWDHGYSISPLPLVCFQYFKIIWTFQSKPELDMVGLCHLEVNIKLCVEYVLIL